jgi:predicted anti-sigma-YlaC factor YlaD
LLTAYVDDELSAGDRFVVEDHLAQCVACRRRVQREGAVRELLRIRSSETRASGAPPWQQDGSPGPRRRSIALLLSVAVLSMVALVVALLDWSRWHDTTSRLIAVGQIDDSRCAGGHVHDSAALRDMSEPDCVHRCVEMGARYVFVSEGLVYDIRNQDFAEVTRFAGQDVQLEGEVHENLLTVSRLRPISAPNNGGTAVAGHGPAAWRAPQGRRRPLG